MGLFDREVSNSWEEMFDYNKDGRIDCGEEAVEYIYNEEISGSSSTSNFDEDEDY